MSASARHVRSLRLRAPDAAACRRGALMLEDALHTATLPDTEGSRLYVVRRLVIGAIEARQSSGQVAETIKNRFEEICSRSVHAGADGAHSRMAVWFRDVGEPALLLAVRLARREMTDAWFWPLAVPCWNPDLTQEEALRALLHDTAESPTPPGPIAAAQFVAGLGAQGALAPLLHALTEADGNRLLHTFGWPLPSQMSAASVSRADRKEKAEEGTGVRSESVSDSSLAVFRRERAEPVQKGLEDRLYTAMIRHWGVSDARSLWLSAMLLIAARPTRSLDAALLLDAQRMAEIVYNFPPSHRLTSPSANRQASAPPASPAFQTPHTDFDSTAQAEEPRSTPLFPSTLFPSALSPEHGRTGENTAAAQSGSGEEQAVEHDGVRDLQAEAFPARNDNDALETGMNGRRENVVPNALSEIDRGELSPLPSFDSFNIYADIQQATEYAGLYFLIAALAHLGKRGRAGTHPPLLEDGLPIRLLHHIGRKMGIGAEDPVLAALPLSTLAPENAPEVETLLDAWRMALRRWCRRYTGMGLDAIIRREGRVRATRTHIDIWLDLRQADIRIRRTGLDIDPGWVPWLGRVILFHYLGGG